MLGMIDQIWNNQSTTDHIVYIVLIILFVIGMIVVIACGGFKGFIWHQTKVHTKDEHLRQMMNELEVDAKIEEIKREMEDKK